MNFLTRIWNETRSFGVLPGMQHLVPSKKQILDEDLQIIRVTLATIVSDVRSLSSRAADAVQEALEKLDKAQREFSRISDSR